MKKTLVSALVVSAVALSSVASIAGCWEIGPFKAPIMNDGSPAIAQQIQEYKAYCTTPRNADKNMVSPMISQTPNFIYCQAIEDVTYTCRISAVNMEGTEGSTGSPVTRVVTQQQIPKGVELDQ